MPLYGTDPRTVPNAYVRFNGTTGAIIGNALNVSGVTRNAVGDYTINFSAALASANYKVFATVETLSSSPTSMRTACVRTAGIGTASCRIHVVNINNNLDDGDSISFVAFGA